MNEFSKGHFISFFELKIRFVLFQRAHSNKKNKENKTIENARALIQVVYKYYSRKTIPDILKDIFI